MLINPLTVYRNRQDTTYEIKAEKIILEITTYIINNYSELLIEAEGNAECKSVTQKIIYEKLTKDYNYLDSDIDDLVKIICDRLFGYHILQKYIEDDEVTDIRVVSWNTIHIMKKGKWSQVKDKFFNQEDYYNFVRYCVLKNHGKITHQNPIVIVSDRKNNLRIEAGITPVNIISPSIAIRIHRSSKNKSLEDLFLKHNMMNSEIYGFLLKAVIAGCNIIIAGKGAVGKTTLLRALINMIPENISITSNEETAELFCTHKNIIQREIVKNRENNNINLESLTRHSLIMTNDAIVIGELKGAEAMSFFDAISTGHRGYATVHAENAYLTIDRLITLMKKDILAQYYQDKYLKEILAQSVDIVIYMKHFKIEEMLEVTFDKEKGEIVYNPLFKLYIEKITDREIKGQFKKENNPKERVKIKLDQSSLEYERLFGSESIEKCSI